jgi:hypothetical protein
MNEMYAMSLELHNIAVWLLIGTFVLNMTLLLTAREIRSYAKRMRILMPVSASLIAAMIFTGTVMMAAKHLSFTIENIVMIVFSVMLIVFEAKRYARLKHADLSVENAFGIYKAKAMKLMSIALGGSLLISGWMLL